MMRACLIVAVSVGCATTTVRPPPAGVRVWESAQEHVTEGETAIAIDASTAYATVTDFARWTAIFPDIVSIAITAQQGSDAHVTLVHRDGNKDNVHFHNRPEARIVWFEDTGGRAEVWYEIAFTPGAQRNTTSVHSRLFADVHGLASLFVSDGKVRAMRQQRVGDDLTHLRAFFAHAEASARR